MNILNISIVLFVIMESLNVIILYFFPDSPYGNGVAIFDFWKNSKSDENSHLFAKYMKNWVAGVKLIFIFLLLVILFTGSETTKVFGVIAMILSIATYYIGLHPIIKKLDKNQQLTPNGYSKALFCMITGFMSMFTIALILHFIL